MNSTEPLIAQEFIPEVSKGDKRIILLDGEILELLIEYPKKVRLDLICMLEGKLLRQNYLLTKNIWK